jgi:ribonuclease E
MCEGHGLVRTPESAALVALRKIHNRVAKGDVALLRVSMPPEVGLYLLNQKRDAVAQLERRYALRIQVAFDDGLMPHQSEFEIRLRGDTEQVEPPQLRLGGVAPPEPLAEQPVAEGDNDAGKDVAAAASTGARSRRGRRRRGRRRRGRGGGVDNGAMAPADGADTTNLDSTATQETGAESYALEPEDSSKTTTLQAQAEELPSAQIEDGGATERHDYESVETASSPAVNDEPQAAAGIASGKRAGAARGSRRRRPAASRKQPARKTPAKTAAPADTPAAAAKPATRRKKEGAGTRSTRTRRRSKPAAADATPKSQSE